MTTVTQPAASAPGETSGHEHAFLPYAQLARMLVPSSGCVSLYDANGELRWSSEGYERPDLREIVETMKLAGASSLQPCVRTTAAGVVAYSASLSSGDGTALGFLIIELKSEREKANSLATHLLSPLVDCLASRLRAEALAAQSSSRLDAGEIDFLIGISELDVNGTDGLRVLLERCMRTLDCAAAAFVSPNPDLNVIVERKNAGRNSRAEVIHRTRRHLLAWAQLNNRPMVVNRVGNAAGPAPYKILSCPVRSETEEIAGLVALFRVATGQNFERRDVHLLEFLCRRVVGLLSSRDDPLTGLLGRATFEELVAASGPQGSDAAPLNADETTIVGTRPGAAAVRPGALLEIDIDRLQSVNDEHGLDAGDAVIREVAGRIKRSLGNTGAATRLAGDRFAVFVPDLDVRRAPEFAARVHAGLSQGAVSFGGASIPVSVSIGLAVRSNDLATTGELTAAASAAAEEARSAGGGRWVRYRHEDHGPALEASEIFAAARLRTALDANHFRLLAQPIVAFVQPATVAGYETLIRLPDHTGALLAPDRFMSVARRYRLAPGVDTWVFSELLRLLEPHGDRLGSLPIGVAVNVSEQSLLSQSYLNSIVSEIARSRLGGSAFSFEVSETDALANLDAAERFIEKIHETGARVALDHFGSGLTSFAQLRRLRVDYLKVGGDLVRSMAGDRHLESMVYGLAKAAESLELPTVAEHVENEALASRLATMGITYGQGFNFGRPAAFEDLFTGGQGGIAL